MLDPTSFRRCLAAATLAASAAAALLTPAAQAGRVRHEGVGFQTFASPQVSPIALSPNGSRLYVANTTSNTVSVIDTATNALVAEVAVGLEPVALGVRPDGLEVWVSNHVSDSVSVIDTDATSATQNQVVETIQQLDPNGATLFDEPAGIAFASNTKAYVALSSRNDIAVVDAVNYAVTGRIHVTAQDPRAIAVRDGLLFVAAFESGNQTEISACPTGGPAPQCTLGQAELQQFVTNPNIPGEEKNIVVDPQAPDRDLFVYRTDTDALVTSLAGVGTLLYGVAAGPAGRVYVTQTDARNDVNGIDTGGGELVALDNRMFRDEVFRATCTTAGCSGLTTFQLHPTPPAQPSPGAELATPYGIDVSGDGNTLVATAAGTSRLFTMNANTGAVLGVLNLGSGASFGQQIPKGVALRSGGGGGPQTAYVLNSLENTVAVVDVTNPAAPSLTTKINVGADPTPAAVRQGAIAFNNAFAASSGTFSCGSCHPDGNTDQLLWRIGGPCFLTGCDGGDEPRTTMPVRGLSDTVPLHWDGVLGDPFGGGNGAVGFGGSGGTDCSLTPADPNGEHACFLDLVMGSLAGVMCDQNPATNPAGCPPGGNELTAQERDDMATFLDSVAYPPARSRRINDTLSRTTDPNPVQVGTITVSALEGFKDFFTNQGGFVGDPDTCADSTGGCHALPLGAATNSSTLNGFEVPTMRGMTDRFLQFSLGVTLPEENQTAANSPSPGVAALEAPIQYSAAAGYEEITVFGVAFAVFQPVYGVRPLNLFQMFEEASTQFPGATGRQVTLNQRTTTGGLLASTESLMSALEEADFDGLVNLRAVGVRDGGSGFAPILLSYRSNNGTYRDENETYIRTHAQLLADAQAGTAVLTLTAALRWAYGSDSHPQPLLSTATTGGGATGDPPIPQITAGGSNPPAFNVRSKLVRTDAAVFVDGVKVTATLACTGGITAPFCNDNSLVSVDLAARPAPDGLHLLQVQNGPGPLSNELPICVGAAAGCQ